jgi:hypothetical protein
MQQPNPQRRFTDRTPNLPRSTYEHPASAVIGNTRLVRRYSFAYAALLALGFEEIHVEDDCALLKAPTGFEVIA